MWKQKLKVHTCNDKHTMHTCLFEPWKRTVKNSHRKSYLKVFDSWISTCHEGCKFQCTRKAGWTKKVYFISTLFLHRRNFSCERQTRFSEFETRFERSYCCHGYHVTEHVLLSTYANFRLFAFLSKSFKVLKSLKALFFFNRNKGVG